MVTTCSICLNNLGFNYTSLECSHNFHSNCINEWRDRNNTCPICRTDIVISNNNNLLQNYCSNWEGILNDNRLSYLTNNRIFTNPVEFRKYKKIKEVTEEEEYLIKHIFDFKVDYMINDYNEITNDKYYLICNWNYGNHFIIGKLTDNQNNIYKIRLDLVHIIYLYRDIGYHNKSRKKRINLDLNKDLIYKLRFG